VLAGRAGLVALLLAAAPAGARAQTAADRMASAQCELCHGDREQMARRAPPGYDPDSLVVDRALLATSVHAGIPCVRCHPIPGLMPHPAEARTTVPCGTCHGVEDSLWRAGPHGGGTG